MKRLLLIGMICSTVLLSSGCDDQYFEQIDELRARVEALAEECLTINSNIAGVQSLVTAIEANDLITNVSDITSQGKVIGYSIEFEKRSPVTIYNGISGSVPYLGIKQMGDKYYWTIQYGDSKNVEFLRDNEGNYVQAVATLPFLKISEDKWYYTCDSGATWQEIGQATGANADAMITSVDASNASYILFHMANGETLKIPTFAEYQALSKIVQELNKNVVTQQSLIDLELLKIVYITKAGPIMEGTDSVGTYIELSNGQKCEIKDWKGTNVPYIRSQLDTMDSNYYWVIQYGEEPFKWVLDENGNRIQSRTSGSMVPLVGVSQEDGQFYWTVSYGDETSYVTKPDGSRIIASDKAFAADSAQVKWFKTVENTSDYLFITMLDGSIIKIPHQYSIEFKVGSTTVASEILIVAADNTVKLSYNAIGGTVKSVATMTEGRVKACHLPDDGCIEITTAKGYGIGSVTMIFTFGEESSTNTKTKKLIIKEQEEL